MAIESNGEEEIRFILYRLDEIIHRLHDMTERLQLQLEILKSKRNWECVDGYTELTEELCNEFNMYKNRLYGVCEQMGDFIEEYMHLCKTHMQCVYGPPPTEQIKSLDPPIEQIKSLLLP